MKAGNEEIIKPGGKNRRILRRKPGSARFQRALAGIMPANFINGR
jgi:hypothetical protein